MMVIIMNDNIKDDNKFFDHIKEDIKKIEYKKYLYILLFILLLLFIALYSRYVSTSGLVVNEIKITDSSLSDSFHGFKIVHLSDILYGGTIKSDDFLDIVEEINLLKPDILVITGDLLDVENDFDDSELIEMLSLIDVTIGKYAISGDNDLGDRWEYIISSSGFVNLNNTIDIIYNGSNSYITISGLSSNLYGNSDIDGKMSNSYDFLNNENSSVYNILIMHEPDYIDDIDYSNYDLVLAGHSLGGQIKLPFIGGLLYPSGAKNYTDTYYDLGNTDFYISSGLGTDIVDFRLFNRPSLNFYRLSN